ncbi:MAG: hypothetical protein ABIR56_04505 [Polaromonas sp.]
MAQPGFTQTRVPDLPPRTPRPIRQMAEAALNPSTSSVDNFVHHYRENP